MSGITAAFESALAWIYSVVGDYGWSVVLFTVAFRLCLTPFDFISRRAMRKQSMDMERLQPKLDALKEKYANDQQKLNTKTMELYKKENVSPFGGCAGGCLPMLIQWPVFIAFFSSIRGVTDMELVKIYETMKAGGTAVIPSFYWVKDLWQPDTFNASVIPAFSNLNNHATFKAMIASGELTEELYNTTMQPLMEQYANQANGFFVLPVLAAAASFFQGWLSINLNKSAEQRAKEAKAKNSGKEDPNAATSKMMQYMFPIMSFFFCMTSSTAFSLYWLASNVVSILSTYVIDKLFLRKMKPKESPKEEIL